MNIKHHIITVKVGSKYFDRETSVRADVFNGQPSILHITESQFKAARKRCAIGDGDYLVRKGPESMTRLVVMASDYSGYSDEIGWF